MKLPLRILLSLSFFSLMAGCRVAFIVVEGGKVLYEDKSSFLHACEHGSICNVDLEWGGKEYDDEFFTAVPDPGWFFHKWNAGERFLCGNSALPVCHLDFEWIEDDPNFPEIYDSAGLFYLMPVFKEYPRVTLANEPRTITADGIKQLWLQPADFTDYSYDQIAAVCPEGICSGTIPGSTIDLTGHFWASSEEVALLFLAYQQLGRFVLDDFERTITFPDNAVTGILHGPPLLPGQDFNCGIATESGDYYIGDDSHMNDLCVWFVFGKPGFWFWRTID